MYDSRELGYSKSYIYFGTTQTHHGNSVIACFCILVSVVNQFLNQYMIHHKLFTTLNLENDPNSTSISFVYSCMSIGVSRELKVCKQKLSVCSFPPSGQQELLLMCELSVSWFLSGFQLTRVSLRITANIVFKQNCLCLSFAQ